MQKSVPFVFSNVVIFYSNCLQPSSSSIVLNYVQNGTFILSRWIMHCKYVLETDYICSKIPHNSSAHRSKNLLFQGRWSQIPASVSVFWIILITLFQQRLLMLVLSLVCVMLWWQQTLVWTGSPSPEKEWRFRNKATAPASSWWSESSLLCVGTVSDFKDFLKKNALRSMETDRSRWDRLSDRYADVWTATSRDYVKLAAFLRFYASVSSENLSPRWKPKFRFIICSIVLQGSTSLSLPTELQNCTLSKTWAWLSVDVRPLPCVLG